MARFLISDNGPHSADQWAMATADEIFQLEESMPADRKIEARQLQVDIASIMQPLHDQIMSEERFALSIDDNHCDSVNDIGDVASFAVDEIVQAAKHSPWAIQIASYEWKAQALATITKHMQTAQHVERLWHADKNPENISAQTYKARFGSGI